MHKWNLVCETAQPVDSVDQRRDLRIGTELREFLVATVHVPDYRIGSDYALSIEAHNESKCSVSSGVLRAKVDDHVAGIELDIYSSIGKVALQTRVYLKSRDSFKIRGGVKIRAGVGGYGWLLSCAHASPASSFDSSSLSDPGIGSTSVSPGHGLTSRASKGKSLRSGWPSNSQGR